MMSWVVRYRYDVVGGVAMGGFAALGMVGGCDRAIPYTSTFPVQCRVGQGSAVQCSAGQCRAVQCSAGSGKYNSIAMQCNSMQCRATHAYYGCSAVPFFTALHHIVYLDHFESKRLLPHRVRPRTPWYRYEPWYLGVAVRVGISGSAAAGGGYAVSLLKPFRHGIVVDAY
jgi:hypothetical protein